MAHLDSPKVCRILARSWLIYGYRPFLYLLMGGSGRIGVLAYTGFAGLRFGALDSGFRVWDLSLACRVGV